MSMVAGKRKSNKKKNVLSNKELTRQVRALKGQEGVRKHVVGFLYNATVLTAGTPDLNYFDDSTLYVGLTVDAIHHYYDCHIKLTSTAASTVRLIYGFDEAFDNADLLASELLDTPAENATPYQATVAVNMKEARHKNADRNYRVTIVKDMYIGLEANVPKVFNVRLPLFNRKTKGSASEAVPFYPFLCATADEANATMSMGVDYYYTDLEQ